MKVVGLKILNDFVDRHEDTRKQINAWLAETEEATWRTPSDIKARYASVSFLSENRIVFNIKGNKYRLVTKVNYKNQIVLILQVGTHAEYSKWKLSKEIKI